MPSNPIIADVHLIHIILITYLSPVALESDASVSFSFSVSLVLSSSYRCCKSVYFSTTGSSLPLLINSCNDSPNDTVELNNDFLDNTSDCSD